MGDLLAVPVFVASGLLLAGGAQKVLNPEAAAAAIGVVVGPVREWPWRGTARIIGILEGAVGAASLASPRPPVVATMALLFLALASFVALVRIRGGAAASCGCLGAEDVPPSALHVAANLLAAGLAAGAVAVHPPGLLAVVRARPTLGAPLVLGLATAAWLAALAVAYLPRLLLAYRTHPRP